MISQLKFLLKLVILKIGSKFLFIERIKNLCYYFSYSDFLQKTIIKHKFKTKHELYDFLIKYLDNEPFDFFEFGVYKGDSIKYWLTKVENSKCNFCGFDSFEGFPIDWDRVTSKMNKSYYKTDFQQLAGCDPRLHLIKGFFHQTIDEYLKSYNFQNKLIVHLDADLYSSTLLVLFKIGKHLRRGDILLFDEFSAAHHEFRAFQDFCNSTFIKYKTLAGIPPFFDQIAFEID